MIAIVPASPAHVGPIAARIRAIDRLECLAFGRTPKQSLRLGIMGAAMAWTAKVDGRPEAMFGVTAVSTLEGIGSPWMLMTEAAPAHRRALVELGRRYSVTMQDHFRILQNFVHADNAVAIRWLLRLGFEIGPVVAIGGQPMRGLVRCANRFPSQPD